MSGAWERLRDRGGGLLASVGRWYGSEPVEPLPTGIAPLDALLGGGLLPRAYFLGGAPASGKSALALQVALNVARSGGHAVYYSAEMGREECEQRLLACLGAEVGRGFRLPDLPALGRGFRERVARARRQGVDMAEFMANVAGGGDPVATLAARMERECPGLAVVEGKPTASGMREDVGALAAEGIRPLVVLDYLTLLDAEGRGGTDTERAAEAVERVRALAYDFRVPVLALAALNRTSMREAKEPPTMGAFRDTSGVEYAAQGAVVLRRGAEMPGTGCVEVEAHAVKLRNGPWPRVARLKFDGARNLFEALA